MTPYDKTHGSSDVPSKSVGFGAMLFLAVALGGAGSIGFVLGKVDGQTANGTLSIAQRSAQNRASTAEWHRKASAAAKFLPPNSIIADKVRLFEAVGNPSQVQSIGDTVYFYWECSDGRIQISADAMLVSYQNSIMGSINSF